MTDQRIALDEPWEPEDSPAGATVGAPAPAAGGSVIPGTATGVPQLWQNLAPRASSVPQAPQAMAPSGDPHDEQNRPVAGSPQFGQGVGTGVSGMPVT